MKANTDIQDKIDNTFKVLDTIEQANVSPFFKDKTMQRLFSEKEETASLWRWFTPQMQFATLACVLIINVYTISQMSSANDNEAISSFALEYGLSTETEPSIFNL